MRMIGHQVMLQAGDTVSRVLPVQKDGTHYVIRFAAELAIDPEEMASAIDSVMLGTNISEAYIAELKTCETDEVVYSYEIGGHTDPDIIPCKTRPLPLACYALWITLLDVPDIHHEPQDMATGSTDAQKSSAAWWLLPLLLVIGLLVYLLKNKRKSTPDNRIDIGEFSFDPKAMTLSYKSERVELTGKESELLYLLYSSANSTVGRELILEKVWGDQGDYVGRTLDVFISKLRKKLEADSRIQIKNIRGVGYKLVLSAV